jgi:hypothetical protein
LSAIDHPRPDAPVSDRSIETLQKNENYHQNEPHQKTFGIECRAKFTCAESLPRRTGAREYIVAGRDAAPLPDIGKDHNAAIESKRNRACVMSLLE